MKKFTLLLILIATPIIASGSQEVERKKEKAGDPAWLQFTQEKDIKKLRGFVEQYSELRGQHIENPRYKNGQTPSVIQRAIYISDAQTIANNIREVIAGGAPIDQTNQRDETTLQWLSGGKGATITNLAIQVLLDNGASIGKKDEENWWWFGGIDALHNSFISRNNYNAARILSGHESVKHIVNRRIRRLASEENFSEPTTYLNAALISPNIPEEDRDAVLENLLKWGADIEEGDVVALAKHHQVSFTADIGTVREIYNEDGELVERIPAPWFVPCFCKPVLSRCTPAMLLNVADKIMAEQPKRPLKEVHPSLEAEIKRYHEATQVATRAALAQDHLLPKDLRNLVLGYVSYIQYIS